jgi:DNA-3-methyladenine glycosylase
LRIGRIVEVEAYGGPEDRASHARSGPTARNRTMFGPPGVAYVYRVYGMHDCLNVVSGPDGAAAAVLVRAVEPIAGLEAMRAARLASATRRAAVRVDGGAERRRLASLPDARLAAGPGLVGAAFSIDRELDGIDLLDPSAPIRLDPARPDDREVVPRSAPRIGVAYAGRPWSALPWRLVDGSSPSVSRRLPG